MMLGHTHMAIMETHMDTKELNIIISIMHLPIMMNMGMLHLMDLTEVTVTMIVMVLMDMDMKPTTLTSTCGLTHRQRLLKRK